jgi:hypothetical protein
MRSLDTVGAFLIGRILPESEPFYLWRLQPLHCLQHGHRA